MGLRVHGKLKIHSQSGQADVGLTNLNTVWGNGTVRAQAQGGYPLPAFSNSVISGFSVCPWRWKATRRYDVRTKYAQNWPETIALEIYVKLQSSKSNLQTLKSCYIIGFVTFPFFFLSFPCSTIKWSSISKVHLWTIWYLKLLSHNHFATAQLCLILKMVSLRVCSVEQVPPPLSTSINFAGQGRCCNLILCNNWKACDLLALLAFFLLT